MCFTCRNSSFASFYPILNINGATWRQRDRQYSAQQQGMGLSRRRIKSVRSLSMLGRLGHGRDIQRRSTYKKYKMSVAVSIKQCSTNSDTRVHELFKVTPSGCLLHFSNTVYTLEYGRQTGGNKHEIL